MQAPDANNALLRFLRLFSATFVQQDPGSVLQLGSGGGQKDDSDDNEKPQRSRGHKKKRSSGMRSTVSHGHLDEASSSDEW